MDRVQISLYPQQLYLDDFPLISFPSNGIATHSTSRKETEKVWESKRFPVIHFKTTGWKQKNKEHKIQLLSFCSPFALQLSNRIAFLPSHQKRKGRFVTISCTKLLGQMPTATRNARPLSLTQMLTYTGSALRTGALDFLYIAGKRSESLLEANLLFWHKRYFEYF